MELYWTKEEACRYHLCSLGLHGRPYLPREEGIRRCSADLDVLQLNPLPVLGRSHDLTIKARVELRELGIAQEARRHRFDGCIRFLSPLDPLLWSRKALRELWDFEYAWEVYKSSGQAPLGLLRAPSAL